MRSETRFKVCQSMITTFEDVLRAARSLPVAEQRELAARLAEETAASEDKARTAQANLAIVEETRGTIKGLDRQTIISVAEDEEFCGY